MSRWWEMRVNVLAGYRYDDGTHVCVNCAHDSENKEALKPHGERDVMFFAEFTETKCPKCAICKIRMLDVVYKISSSKDDDEDSTKKKPLVKSKKPAEEKPTDSPTKRRGRPPKAPTEPVAKRGRGRPPKAKAELYYNDEALSEPVVKRGRGRPKGSKNKTGAML
jgi:hypothetical protein